MQLIYTGSIKDSEVKVFRSEYTTDVYVVNAAHFFDLASWQVANQLEVLCGVDMDEWVPLTRFNIDQDVVIRYQKF